MTIKYVTVRITGTFPAEDVDGLAAIYGIGNSMMGNSTPVTQEAKLNALIAMAEQRLTDFLAISAKQAARAASETALRETTTAIDERVKSGLVSEIVSE